MTNDGYRQKMVEDKRVGNTSTANYMGIETIIEIVYRQCCIDLEVDINESLKVISSLVYIKIPGFGPTHGYLNKVSTTN